MITIHTSLTNRAKRMLDERYYELEEKGEERRWIDDFLKHKKAIEWLQTQEPDNK
ncbi:hypothetical protein [Spirosoma arcticum]